MAIIQGIILYTRPYKERDLLVRMLTEKAGLRTFFARGAKKNNSPLAAATQPYTKFTFDGQLPKNNQGLGFINSVQGSTFYRKITEDVGISAYVALIVKLIDASFEEGIPLPDWYQELTVALEKLNAGLDPQIIANIFEIKLLTPLGVAPNWRADPLDGQMTGIFDYSEKYNGILGQNHFNLDDNRLHLDQKTIYYLRQFSQIDLAQIHEIKLSPATKRSLQRVIDYIYEKQVGLVPREKHFIQQMATWQVAAQKLAQQRKQQ
ncbi:DNA repair protein RecO [Convivina intestini]|uniref:DNA repair protein RecO n=1 Tax=Convivina intestini TaxID=1505726 RepID=A0A2U1DF84_9LACO|nr:DNA repair protein RecO [Convivina intestini]PVY86212.1 DNA replication and repair protein RecO [Convivina intestini]CAH1851356.1 DNA repair protein RecO [Convivina intestini]CAH1851995.1 DNA repair protein RecO [Convivina intestini]SDB81538.1 DNA replication and repair protein RecO [Leuconostocaceae bacterium R-53105]